MRQIIQRGVDETEECYLHGPMAVAVLDRYRWGEKEGRTLDKWERIEQEEGADDDVDAVVHQNTKTAAAQDRQAYIQTHRN